MAKLLRKRFVTEEKLTREQALWLCKAILTHYRIDGQQTSDQHDDFNWLNRVHKTGRYKRGRDWSVHPIGFDLKEAWYGTQKSGIREAWAGLVALPVSKDQAAPEDHRTYRVYGLRDNNTLSIAVYRVTEVVATSKDASYLKYVGECFKQLQPDAEEVPEYDPKGRLGATKKVQEKKPKWASRRRRSS